MSTHEETFALHCKINKIAVVREFKFHPSRKWRTDFAIPEKMLLIEIEGGTWINGRHNRGAGIEEDMYKYNAAAMLGYTVLRYTAAMVKSLVAIREVENFIKR